MSNLSLALEGLEASKGLDIEETAYRLGRIAGSRFPCDQIPFCLTDAITYLELYKDIMKKHIVAILEVTITELKLQKEQGE